MDKYRRCDGLLKELEYLDIKMLNNVNEIATNEPLKFEMTIKRNDEKIDKCQFGVIIKDSGDISIGGCYSNVLNLPSSGDVFKIYYEIPYHQLSKGKYSLVFNISKFDYMSNIKDYDIVRNVISFQITHVDINHNIPFLIWPKLGACSYQNSFIKLI